MLKITFEHKFSVNVISLTHPLLLCNLSNSDVDFHTQNFKYFDFSKKGKQLFFPLSILFTKLQPLFFPRDQ